MQATQSILSSHVLTEDALTDLCLRFRPDKAAQARDSSLCVTPLITEMIVDGKSFPLRLQEDRWGAGVVRVSTIKQRSAKAHDDKFTKSGRKKDEGYSEEEQIRRAIRYFVREGIAFKIYSDAGVGGEYPNSDPALVKRLLGKKATRQKRIFGKVLLDETSRTRRSAEDIARLEAYIADRVKQIENGGVTEDELYTPSSSMSEELGKRRRRGPSRRKAFFRQGFSQLWDDIRADKVYVVAATDRSRLCRDADLEMAFLETMAKHNVKIKGLIEDLSSLDISDAVKKGINYMVASLHESRLEETATAVFRGKIQKLESGEIYRQLPWWLTRDSKRNILLPEDKKAVAKRIVALFLAGHAEGSIYRRLRAEGITVDGKSLTIGKVRNLITGESVLGINREYGIEWHNLPAVITDETVREEFLDAQRARSNSRSNEDFTQWRNHLLTGLLRCHCGRVMKLDVKYGKRSHDYYRCVHENKKGTNTWHPSIRDDQLTAFIMELVVSNPNLLTGELSRSLTGSDFAERTMRRQFLEEELRTATATFEAKRQSKLETARKRALDEGDAEPDSEDFNRLVEIYSRKNLKQEIAALEKMKSEFDGLSVHMAEDQRISKVFSHIDALQGWDKLDALQRRRLLQSVFESITVYPRQLGYYLVLKLHGTDTPLPPVRLITEQRTWSRFPTVAEWVADMAEPERAERTQRDCLQMRGIRVTELTPFYDYVRFGTEEWAARWLKLFRENPAIYRRFCRREYLENSLIRCGVSDEMLAEFNEVWDQYMESERQRLLGDDGTNLTVGYLYVATSTPNLDVVLQQQQRDIEALAAAQGHQIEKWFRDIGSRRKALNELTDKAATGRVTQVYVTHANRFSRNKQLVNNVLNTFSDHGVPVYMCQP